MRESALSLYLSWAPGTEFGSSDLCVKDPYLLTRLASHTQGMFTLYIEARNNKYLSFHIITLRVSFSCLRTARGYPISRQPFNCTSFLY